MTQTFVEGTKIIREPGRDIHVSAQVSGRAGVGRRAGVQ